MHSLLIRQQKQGNTNANKAKQMNRRQFIQGLIAMGISPSLLAQAEQQTEQQTDWIFSAQGAKKSQFGFATHQNQTSIKSTNMTGTTGFRGHGASQHPIEKHRVVLFARRPGTQGVEIDLRTGQITKRFGAQANRHFFGHGTFSADGRFLYTTETDLTQNQGMIGIRDAKTYQWLGEYASYGIGPHDIHMMPDQKTLVIANGGILTRPETGRQKLNLDTMQSSLVYLDSQTGELLEKHSVPESKASIRHLAVAADGTVAIAMQLQRQALGHNQAVSLAALHQQGEAIQHLQAPENIWYALNDYLGSVSISNQNCTVGFTSPRGNLAIFWDMDTAQFKGYYPLNDVCGLTTSLDEQRFILSNSFGTLRHISAANLIEDKSKRQKFPQIAWDNHLFKLHPFQSSFL